MPELPEVERAAALVRTVGTGKLIQQVESVEDSLVFSGINHSEFAAEVTGRTIKDARRYGKLFYIELDGKGRFPVLHFGMTGMLQVKGELAIYYKETPRSATHLWPPKFMKFILHLQDPITKDILQLAFLDARRLGRIRLCASPLDEPPISELGFDPILSMPSLEDFKPKVLKRSCPVKALLLDQSFSAGVGNWVADEILYHARVHPEQRCNKLSEEQISAIHHHIADVCRQAVAVNADDTRFPKNWLMKHRWGKGKKTHEHTLKLPSGQPATIKWLTVGGRTSAFVEELQVLSRPSAATEESADIKETNEMAGLRDPSADGSKDETSLKRKQHPSPPPSPLRRSSTRLAERKIATIPSRPSPKKKGSRAK